MCHLLRCAPPVSRHSNRPTTRGADITHPLTGAAQLVHRERPDPGNASSSARPVSGPARFLPAPRQRTSSIPAPYAPCQDPLQRAPTRSVPPGPPGSRATIPPPPPPRQAPVPRITIIPANAPGGPSICAVWTRTTITIPAANTSLWANATVSPRLSVYSQDRDDDESSLPSMKPGAYE